MSATTQLETVQPKDSLNSLETLTKSKRGGKRVGAGRPAEEYSIRSEVSGRFEDGTLTAQETHYKVWREGFVFRKAHRLIYKLSTLDNEFARPLHIHVYDSATLSPLLSPHQALQLARIFSHDHQLNVLLLKHRHALELFVAQYGDCRRVEEELVSLAGSLLERGGA
jgi:hypothetical protein